MTKRALIIMTMLGLVATMSPAAANTQNQDYVAGPVGDFAGICADDNPTGLNIARICFPASPGNSYKLWAEDTHGQRVGFEWSFRDANGVCVGEDPDDPLASCDNVGFVCDTTTVLAPPGTVEVHMLIDGPIFGAADCLAGGPGDSPGFGTVGTAFRQKL